MKRLKNVQIVPIAIRHTVYPMHLENLKRYRVFYFNWTSDHRMIR